MNRFDSKVELYYTADDTLWESNDTARAEALGTIKELACLAFAFVVIAAIYWWM